MILFIKPSSLLILCDLHAGDAKLAAMRERLFLRAVGAHQLAAPVLGGAPRLSPRSLPPVHGGAPRARKKLLASPRRLDELPLAALARRTPRGRVTLAALQLSETTPPAAARPAGLKPHRSI